MKHLESYSILTDYQHGFRAKRSTETQLILTVHDIVGALNSKRQVDLAILDFTKAFDKVPHGRLISKLEYYGIQGPTLNWLKAFLTNREQTVVVEGKASAPVKVASGVPQGTVLGPLLFLLYINDLPDQLDSNVRLFADDCLLYVELSTQTDSQLLQKDLNTLEEWQSKWLMQFNPEKCYIMHITNKRTPHATSYQFCGQALATTKIHPYLGVTLTSGLKYPCLPVGRRSHNARYQFCDQSWVGRAEVGHSGNSLRCAVFEANRSTLDEEAFLYAVRQINQGRTVLPKARLVPHVERLRSPDPFLAIQTGLNNNSLSLHMDQQMYRPPPLMTCHEQARKCAISGSTGRAAAGQDIHSYLPTILPRMDASNF
ncbi:hypothetical protein Bbelb_420290 [Branchiostoma belcheri]|nr:hypothetical protein Bbelb_420290 [Branchiostoma belcheri]